MEHTFILELGDPSGDGHGQSDRYTYRSNLDSHGLVIAYRMAAHKHKLNITDECTNYKCIKLRKQFIDRFNEVFADDAEALKLIQDCGWGEGNLGPDQHAEIYLHIAKLAHPELVWEQASNLVQIVDIGGYGYFSV